ncbi:MAG: serine/threonine protein kinase, partial [Xanthomonadales bacterium]|nr:serine/threonine protein kinase [Xanthomonadales bacterium]
MDRERTLEALIERMLSGESLAGPPGAGATPVALRRLEHVFAGFSQARSQPVDDGAIAHAAGEILGTFRLRERIGVGGMGEVWLAERADGAVEQRVAIKFVRDAQARWADRLEHERRLLARLAHPYIARFLDAGRDAGGMPYLVMEYVVGEPVDRWCEAQALDLAGRIDLVFKVCEAVEHAHRQLVVHRDLKPANILVCADGTPRLLDFGIATLIESADDLRMQSESPLLTLAWAAPEQLAGRAVSTATDVHALGLVLFELLCGRLPPARRDGS